MNQNQRKGVTLAEMLLVMLLTGVIIVLSIQVFRPEKPNKMLTRSAFSLLRQITGEILSTDSDGVINTDGSYCSNAFSRLNTLETPVMNCNPGNDVLNFMLTNGMIFYGMGNTTFPITVAVDVNGDSYPGDTTGGYNLANENNDLFRFNVYSNGRVEPVSVNAKQYINCKLVMDSYDPAWVTDVRNVVKNVLGTDDTGANTFMSNLPGVLSNAMSYSDAEGNVFVSSKLDVFGASPKASIAIHYLNN